MNAITIDHLRKTYGAFVALDDLTLSIPQGSVFGLLGPNGAGKTTTFKCMLGLVRPDGGTTRFSDQTFSPAVLDRIAYVPERSVLYEGMSVAEHIEMQRRAYSKFDADRARELVKGFGIPDLRRKTGKLSKGMRTAVAVALAFSRSAEVLVLDEPTSGLDPVNQRTVLNLIVNEAASGNTVVFSSHQVGHVERAAERIAIMKDGRLALEGMVDDLKADRKIVEGIMPDDNATVGALNGNPHVRRVERNGRILRAFVSGDAGAIAEAMSAGGAAGVRVVDLDLEDIFFDAVAPASSTADLVEA